jgi:hypothetical protein
MIFFPLTSQMIQAIQVLRFHLLELEKVRIFISLPQSKTFIIFKKKEKKKKSTIYPSKFKFLMNKDQK